jgi:triacylglycerol esterase/lipase EstA (alpha/beta hydrolase family)
MGRLGQVLTATTRTAIRASAGAAVTTAAALTGSGTSPGSSGVGSQTGLGGRRVRERLGTRPVSGDATGGARPPVVVAHGYLDGHLSPWWDRLTALLGEAGWSTEHVYTADTPNLPGLAVGRPTRYTDGLQAALDRSYDRHGRPATVIGHSMGGLVGRHCIERGDGGDYVDDLITLGTPHQGTYAAYLGYLTAGGRALAPGSDFLTDLNGDPLHPDVRYTSVYSLADPLVRPARSGRIPEAIREPDTENIRTGRQSHVQLVHDPGVFDHYAERLG